MLTLAQTRRTEAAEKLLKAYRDACVEECFSPGTVDRDWVWRSKKALLDILTGDAKLVVPAPKVEDYKPESEAA